jgi:Uma2 family endonuclease
MLPDHTQVKTMTLAAPTSITLAEFLQLDYINESPAWEYINGEVRQKTMGGLKHSTLQKRLVSAIDSASSDPTNPYEAFPELRCTPNGRSVVPDIAILRQNDVPLDINGDLSSQGIDFAPPWVIEVLSPGQNQTKVTSNILYCLRHGSRLGWLIDPAAKAVIVYQLDRLPEVLTNDAILPVVDGLTLALTADQIFSWLKKSRS